MKCMDATPASQIMSQTCLYGIVILWVQLNNGFQNAFLPYTTPERALSDIIQRQMHQKCWVAEVISCMYHINITYNSLMQHTKTWKWFVLHAVSRMILKHTRVTYCYRFHAVKIHFMLLNSDSVKRHVSQSIRRFYTSVITRAQSFKP